mmetsp:Transcript_82494/g.231373  ORF Transcript_82494/g.231373 Transcript_82494/m.231373 type:complete len:81 (-) Transcript_82494:718-960(-)
MAHAPSPGGAILTVLGSNTNGMGNKMSSSAPSSMSDSSELPAVLVDCELAPDTDADVETLDGDRNGAWGDTSSSWARLRP